jgi:hypothetical protein
MPLPDPPLDSSIEPAVQTVVTAFMAAVAIGTLIFAFLYWRRTGRAMFLLLFIAGGAMMLFEPMVDTVGAVWFPEENSWVAFTAYGRPIPVWLCLTYFFFFGLGVSLGYLALKRSPTQRTLWLLFAAGIAGDIVLETTLLAFDTYIYYADQPLVILNFPWWWPPVNSLIVVLAVAAVYRLDDELQGAKELLVIPIALTASAAGNAMAGWPSWFVINTPMPWVLTQAGGLLTWAFALSLMAVVARLSGLPAAEPSPARAPRRRALRVEGKANPAG